MIRLRARTPSSAWREMHEITLCDLVLPRRDGDGRLGVEVTVLTVEGLTRHGVRVRVRYAARGDYEDRWVDRHGRPVEIVRWRP